jgi:HSP20 family protein
MRPSQFFDFLLAPLASHPQAAWRPAVDVYRCQHGWLLKFDLAGVRSDDLNVEIHESLVTVSGVRRDWRVAEHQEAHQLEIAYSRFERSVELPESLADADIRSEYRDGMLLVHIVTKRSP